MAEFLDKYPEFNTATQVLRVRAFHKWVNDKELYELSAHQEQKHSEQDVAFDS